MTHFLFEDKSRWQHFSYAICLGFFLTILCVLGAAFALEFKDYQWGGKWDWKDLTCTLLGGIIGQILQILLFITIFKGM